MKNNKDFKRLSKYLRHRYPNRVITSLMKDKSGSRWTYTLEHYTSIFDIWVDDRGNVHNPSN